MTVREVNAMSRIIRRKAARLPAGLAGMLMLALAGGCYSGSGEAENAGTPAPFAYSAQPDYYTERYRPQYHLSPETGNMSDPNGMVYFEGEYHQFYQNSGQWGHAVSRDLLHWEHLPVALARDSLGEIWSGSAVVDWKDTSGLFGGKPGLVAIFTHYQGGLQSQSIAYSKDKGRTWIKYEGNPVLPNPGLKDFRDPKVIWHESSKSWVMAVSVDQKISFYTSPDLLVWTWASDFGEGQGSHAAVWECPDLFPLPIEGTRKTKWVLAVSIGNNTATKGSTAQYFVGDFDGKRFINANDPSTVLWTDYGKDFYAAVSYSDIPAKDGRRIYMGWMSNWRYPFSMPTSPWKGNLSVPRELKLRELPGVGLRLVQTPVKELEALRGEAVALPARDLQPGENPLLGLRGTSFELEAELALSPEARLELKVRKGQGQETVIRYDAGAARLYVDRTKSGDASFEAGFAETVEAPVQARDGKLKLRLYADESTLEVFANDGEAAISSLIYPDPISNGLELGVSRGTVRLETLRFYPMRTVWRDEAADGSRPLRLLLAKESADVAAGETAAVTAAVLPLTAPQELKWSSGDESVAMVRSTGGTTAEISGVKEGSAEITASTPDGSIHAVLNVFVYHR